AIPPWKEMNVGGLAHAECARGPSNFQPCPCGGRDSPEPDLSLRGPETPGYGRGNCPALLTSSTHRLLEAVGMNPDVKLRARLLQSFQRGGVAHVGSLQRALGRVRAIGLAADDAALG